MAKSKKPIRWYDVGQFGWRYKRTKSKKLYRFLKKQARENPKKELLKWEKVQFD